MNHYTILRANDPEELILAVNKMMDDGWEPLGGVAMLHTEGSFGKPARNVWVQAMGKI